jgi:hypothetical protein
MDLVVRTTVDPASLTSVLRREIHALDPSLPFYDDARRRGRAIGGHVADHQPPLAWFSIAAVAASPGSTAPSLSASDSASRSSACGWRSALARGRPPPGAAAGVDARLVGVAIGLAPQRGSRT